MACNKNDRKNRPINIVPDTGVKYTGEDIDSLGVCSEDYQDQITEIILQKLQDYATGIGISLPDIDFTTCAFLQDFISCCAADKSLTGLMSTVFKAFCTIDGEISAINTTIAGLPSYTVLPGCLSVSNTRIDTVLNKLISEYCAFVQKVTTIFGNLDNPVLNQTIINEISTTAINTVFNNIKGCSNTDIVKTGTGLNTILTIKGIVPVGSFLFGQWDSSYFDNSGVGLPEKGMCGWAIPNGNSGRPDLRGFGLAMATNIGSNVSLNSKVDPTYNADADYATNIGDIKGEVKHKLTSAESGIPAHTHGASATGNTYTTAPTVFDFTGGGGIRYAWPSAPPVGNITILPNTATDAQVKHENRQPTKYVNCIMRIS